MQTILTGTRARRFFEPAFAGTCVALLLLSSCAKQPAGESVTGAQDVESASASSVHRAEPAARFEWAREALQRNPQIELLATDRDTGVFTVRIKESGEVHAVNADELAAMPVAAMTGSARTAAASRQAVPADAAARSPSDPTLHPDASAGAPGTDTGLAGKPAPSTPNYTIERTDGQLRVSGPGVSIVSAGGGEASETPAASQLSDAPIICEGRRMLHLDNRQLRVAGDAIVARGGCELHITNSRVEATGTGIVIEDATVHIANSTIDGAAASFAAGDQAKVFIRSSTLIGVPRRSQGTIVSDQGGNEWR